MKEKYVRKDRKRFKKKKEKKKPGMEEKQREEEWKGGNMRET